MKKVFVIILCMILLIPAFAAFAEDIQPVFQIDDASSECGENVTVSVELKDNADLASFTLDIEYDKTMLQPVSVSKTDLLQGQMIPNLHYKDNVLRIVYASDKNVDSLGEILKITFKVNEYQKGGTEASLTGNIVFLGNQELESIGGAVKNSKVIIAENPNYVENAEKSLVISSAKCRAKEETVITVSASEALDACSGSMTICYDSGLQVLQCEKGEIMNEFNVMINPENDKNQIRMNFMGVTPLSAAGEFIKIKFSAKSNETKNYNIFIKDAELFKLDESFIPVKSNVGVIEVTEVKTGSSGGGAVKRPAQSEKNSSGSQETAEPDKNETQHAIWSNPFLDVRESDWFYKNVRYAVENKLMNGVSTDKFNPDEALTRAMLVTILYRYAGEPDENNSVPFADVALGLYYSDAVKWAYQKKIVTGVSENEFAPDRNITREEIAAIIYRYAKYSENNTNVEEDADLALYNDFNDISEYAITAMQYAVGKGLIVGKTDTTLNPKDNATRAEFAAVLQRFIEA